jgi:hypothetical protein
MDKKNYGDVTLYTPYAIEHYSLKDHKKIFPDIVVASKNKRGVDIVIASYMVNKVVQITQNEQLPEPARKFASELFNKWERSSSLTVKNTADILDKIQKLTKKFDPDLFDNVGFYTPYEFPITGQTRIHQRMTQTILMIDSGFKLVSAFDRYKLIPKDDIKNFKYEIGNPLRRFQHAVHSKTRLLRNKEKIVEPYFTEGDAY